MNLLAILECPLGIWIGAPIIVFLLVLREQYRQVKREINSPGPYYGQRLQIQWKYPIGYGIGAIVGVLILALLSLAFS